jgi:hypothetical protein
VRSTEQKGNFKTIFSSKFLSFFQLFNKVFELNAFGREFQLELKLVTHMPDFH